MSDEPGKKPPSLLRAASPLMVARGISAVLTFSIPIVLARALTQPEYGTYKQFFLLAATVFLMGQAGLTASLYYFMPRHTGAARARYLVQALGGLFVVGAAAAAGTLLLGGALAARFRNPQLAVLAPALAVYLWAFLGSAPLEISLTATKRTGWAGIITVLSDIVRTAALVLPIHFGFGITGLAWAAAGFAVLRLIAAWTLAFTGAFGPVVRPSLAAFREQLTYSLPFAGAILLAVAQMQLAQYFVAAMTDAATFAIYAVGVLQIPLTDMLYTPIAEVMMVRLAQTQTAGMPPIFKDATAKLCMFFLPLTAFALAIGPALIPALYTVRYLASVPIFLLALIELPLSAMPIDGLLRSLNANATLLHIGVVRLAIAVVLVPAGFFSLGLPGAMVGYVTTQWIAKSLMLYSAARRLDAPVSTLLPFSSIGAWSLRALVVFAVVTGLRLYGPWHGMHFLVAASLASTLVWLGMLYVSRLAPRGATRAAVAPVAPIAPAPEIHESSRLVS